ncbi:MAG: SDR family oxidoreductase [Sumerlaeia bacterium]
MSEHYTVEDKVVWITGSAKRVGRAIALELARHGAHIVVHCRSSREEADATAGEIHRLGRRALVVQGDHTRRTDVTRIVSEIDAEFGRLDALVNSASTFDKGHFEDIADEAFFQALSVNLHGPFLCAQLALPLLRRSSPGPAHIVNIVDWAVIRPYRFHSAYHAAKGGLDTLTRALAKELAPHIMVNSIAPGPMIPPPGTSDEEKAKVAENTLVKHWGSGEDIAHAARFLIESNFITGVRLPVDGGMSMVGGRG